jgi:hypothetical protein
VVVRTGGITSHDKMGFCFQRTKCSGRDGTGTSAFAEC